MAGVLLGQRGRVVIVRNKTQPFEFTKESIDSTRSRLIELEDKGLVTGDFVKVSNPNGLPFDFNLDGQADCPDGHNIYAAADNILSSAVYQRTSDAGRFYDTNDNRYFYANPINHPTTDEASLFVSSNELNNLKFYPNWQSAINRKNPLPIYQQSYGTTTVTPIEQEEQTFGEVEGWEFSSTKAEIDITSLGQNFADKVGSTISGQGSLDCFFPIPDNCSTEHLNYYLFNVVNKINSGSDLKLYLFLNYDEDLLDDEDVKVLYYIVDVIITNSSVQVNTQGAITASLNFVSVGSYDMAVGNPYFIN